MKKIIYILVLSLFIFNCSKSDDDNSPESCNTFLECNDGSTWILDDDIVVIILRINDNINDPLEQWFTLGIAILTFTITTLIVLKGNKVTKTYSIIIGLTISSIIAIMINLIIGGGLAGVTLAWQLIKKGQGVLLIDNKQNKSSSIAAGMINPIVFRRVTKSWRVDEFIPKAKDFYREVEAATGSQFFDSIKIRRFFSSEQEKQSWHQKQEEETASDSHESFALTQFEQKQQVCEIN